MSVSAESGVESPAALAEVPGRVTLFGFEPAEATLHVRPRDRRWRLVGAGRILGVTVLMAPAAALVPPHAPWALGALGIGGLLAHRRMNERFTLEAVTALCPRCGAPLRARRSRLRTPHPVPCEGCHHEVAVTADPGAMDALRAATD